MDPDAQRKRTLCIVELMAEGKTNADICHILGIHKQIIFTWTKHLRTELGANSRYELVEYAITRRLIQRPANPIKATQLTETETAVLLRLAREERDGEIADALDITRDVVRGVLKTIRIKLHVRKRDQIVPSAVAAGLVPARILRTTVPNFLTELDCLHLRLLDEHLTPREIADKRGIKPTSATGSLKIVRSKLRVEDPYDAPKMARKFGLISACGERVARVPAGTRERLIAFRPQPLLSARQIDLLEAMQGSTETPHLASRLGIKPESATEACFILARELGVRTRQECVVRGIELGIIDDDRRSLRERLAFGRQEWAYAKMMVAGKTRHWAAAKLGLSVSAIATMQNNIRYKLGATSRRATIEALRKAIADG